MINPAFKAGHDDEAASRGVSANQAWDDILYTDLETVEDFIAKARAIIAGEPYDTRIQVPVDFSDEELLTYMKLAHERDITFNQLVEEALREAIEKYKCA
jgi:collagenase-like PrtC family protease